MADNNQYYVFGDKSKDPSNDISSTDFFNIANSMGESNQQEFPGLFREQTIDIGIYGNVNNSEQQGVDPSKPNSFVHNASNNNEKTTSMHDKGVISDINLNDFVLPYENILQKYHNPTWMFSLYTMNAQEYNLYLDNPNIEVSKYIIAQSGVTGRYSINEVKMTSAGPATPGLTTNYSMNTFTVEIVENGGMHLYDDIVVLSNELGYLKFMDVPLILELSFVGYDQNTGVPNVIPGVNKKWGVRINTISGSATDSGASMVYTLSLTSSRYGASGNNEDWTLKETFKCTAATFGGFIQDLESHLNKIEEKQRGYLKYKYAELNSNNFYQFKVSQEMASMTINYDVKQSPSVGRTAGGEDGAKLFTWDASKPISRVIDDVLDCCVPLHGTTDNARQFANVIPQSRYVGYDNLKFDSVYQNIFYIVRYQIGDVVSKGDLEKDKFNVEYFIDNAYKVTDPYSDTKKLNIKRYDYQFSGLNNEILDLDLKFDQGFNIAITRNPSSQIDYQNTQGTHNAQIIEFGDVTYNTASEEDVRSLWKHRTELLQKEEDGYVLSDAERQFTRDAEAAARESQNVEGSEDQYNEIPFIPQDAQYVEDLRNTRDISLEGSRGIGIPEVKSIPTRPQNIDTNPEAARRDNSSDNEMERRLVRDNYYNRTFLAKIDLKVLGDPFWLGWSDYPFLEYLNRAVNGEDMSVSDEDLHFANYITTEAYFLLNLKPIVSISDETGLIELNQASVFAQSLYRVNKIVSEFTKGGKFHQTIQGGLVVRSLRRKNQYDDNME